MERNCQIYKNCNRKGKPSVMKYSAYCDSNVINIHKELFWETLKLRLNIFKKAKDFFFERRFDEKTNKLNTKGFRKNWFE